MHDVFISYSRKDAEFVDSLIDFFDHQQISYFRDTKDLPPAVIWRDELKNAIIDADNLLFIVSPESVGSEYCRMEREFADEHNKRVIPILYRSTSVDDIPSELAQWQMLVFDSTAKETLFDATLSIIRQEREWRKQGSGYLRRAENWRADPEAWGFLAREELDAARHWIEKGSTMEPGPLPVQLRYIHDSEAFHLREAEKVQLLYSKALARQLAAQAQVMIEQQGVLLETAALLAVESMRRLPTLEGDQAIRKALFLLARKTCDITLADDQSVGDVVYSPDGRQVAAIAKNGVVYVWDTVSGEALADFKLPASRKLLFIPAHEQLIVLGQSVKIMDIPGGTEVADLRLPNTTDADISSDGGFLVTVGADNLTRLWDTNNWENFALYLNGSPMRFVAIARDAREIVTWDQNQAEIFISPGTPATTMPLDTLGTVQFEYSSDGKYLAQVAASNYTATLFDVASRQQIIFEERHWNVAFSGDSERFALASPEWDAHVYYLPSTWWVGHYMKNTQQATVERKHIRGRASTWREGTVRHDNSTTTVTLSQSGKYLGTTSRDKTARVWESVRGREVTRLLESEEGALSSLHFHQNERYVTARTGQGFRTWEVAGHRQVFELRHEDSIYDLCFSRDNKRVASISQDRSCRVWNIADGSEILRHEPGPGPNGFYGGIVEFSPDGNRLMINQRQIVDLSTGEVTILASRETVTGPFAVSEDWQYAASVVNDSVVEIRGFDSSEVLFRSPPCTDKVRKLTVNSQAHWVIMVTEAASLFIWYWDQPDQISEVAADIKARSLQSGEPGTRLAVLDEADITTVRVIDLVNQQQIRSITHEAKVTHASLDPSERYLATSSSDFKARVWDLTTGEQVCQFSHDADVTTVKFSYGEARYIASGGGRSDRCVRVWLWKPEDLVVEACSRLHRDLTEEEWHQYLGDEPYCRTREL